MVTADRGAIVLARRVHPELAQVLRRDPRRKQALFRRLGLAVNVEPACDDGRHVLVSSNV